MYSESWLLGFFKCGFYVHMTNLSSTCIYNRQPYSRLQPGSAEPYGMLAFGRPRKQRAKRPASSLEFHSNILREVDLRTEIDAERIHSEEANGLGASTLRVK
eukprot:3295325-Pleurochrysis_carterae.AAC.6